MGENRPKPYAWDKGLDFDKERRRLLKIIRMRPSGERDLVRRAYAAVLYIQLMNGLRIGEAVKAAQKWARTRSREVRVTVEKRRDGYERLVRIPRELGEDVRKLILSYVNDERAVSRIKTWCRRYLGYNTHALRYAWISFMALRGYSAELIAKLSGHKKLDYILHYTQKVAAEEILRQLVP